MASKRTTTIFRSWVTRPDGTVVTAAELGVRGIPIHPAKGGGKKKPKSK
jgi:hypothetical protein